MRTAPLIIGPDDVAELLGCSTRHVYSIRRQTRFPQPLRLLGPTSKPRWRRADVVRWIEEIAAPEPAQPTSEEPSL